MDVQLMALLSDLFTGQAGASPWGVLYQPSPVTEQDSRARETAAYGSMGADPASLLPQSPFGPAPDLTPKAPAPQAPGFGAGAAPFGFRGPGSMQVDPSMLAPPPAFVAGATPVPFYSGPVTQQPPAGPATNWPPANRSPPASRASTPDYSIPIGRQADGSTYNMPAFGQPTAAPAPADPGIGNRLSAGLNGFAGGARTGLLSALSGGIEGLSTGQAPLNATARALLAKGVSPADVRAAQNNQDVMKALINRYYGPKTAGATNVINNPNLNPARRAPAAPATGSIQNGYRFRGGNPADRNNWEQL
jgi:hypothetical protein